MVKIQLAGKKDQKSVEMIKKEEKELFQVKFGEAILGRRAKRLQGWARGHMECYIL